MRFWLYLQQFILTQLINKNQTFLITKCSLILGKFYFIYTYGLKNIKNKNHLLRFNIVRQTFYA